MLGALGGERVARRLKGGGGRNCCPFEFSINSALLVGGGKLVSSAKNRDVRFFVLAAGDMALKKLIVMPVEKKKNVP